MNRRVIIFDDEKNKPNDAPNWERVGPVVTQISQLYQTVKEQQIDLIIVGENRTELKPPVAARIRRYNGLTEIWKVKKEDEEYNQAEEYLDGMIPLTLGEDGIVAKVTQVLNSKTFLAKNKIVARSSKMKIVAETVERIAPTDVSVLIVGPSGAGKELIAHSIHNNSVRKDNSFVAINCGAIAEGLLESELFGHEKGAFTGSISKREGLFRKADKGTIFLDEIGETKPEMQVKLLRVLEDGTFYPVGSSEASYSNVRLISATNLDLNEAIADKQFRDDLYYRISVVKIVLPPLFERKTDIEPLVQHFWRGHNLEYTDSAMDMLVSYDWPGNVRQLKNFCDRMSALKQKGLVDHVDVEGFIEEQHGYIHNLPVSTGKTVEESGQELIYHAILSLGSEIRMLRDLITANLPDNNLGDDPSVSAEEVLKGMTVEQVEKLMIRHILAETNGNRKEAAKKLGMGERTLYRKLKKYKLG